VPAVEVMLNTPYIADLIKRGKIDEIKGAMEKAMIRGCQTFDNSLYELWRTGKASEAEVLKHADSRNNLALKIRVDNMGRWHEVPPIKQEITFNETAPFADLKTFRTTPIKHEVGMHIDVTPPSKVHSMMIANIVDTKTKEVVWRMKSSRESDELERLTQEQVNELMAELFGAFPPG